MKKFRNAIILVLCALLLVGGTFAATLAYLTSKDQATNTFTVGNVKITLDEADVDEYGVVIPDADPERVDNNNYLLIPNKTYIKDPIIHVDTASESAWIFVKIENNIADALVVDGEKSIAAQLAANGWLLVDGETNVYYNSVKYEKGAVDKNYEVFESITVKDMITNAELDAAAQNKQIVITGYAIQADGFDTAKDAWVAAGAQAATVDA